MDQRALLAWRAVSVGDYCSDVSSLQPSSGDPLPPDDLALSLTERVLPCMFDPGNGRAGWRFSDTDKLLRVTTYRPMASSHLMSVSLFLIPHGCSEASQAAICCCCCSLTPAMLLWSRGYRPCLARKYCRWSSKQELHQYLV